MAAVSDLIDQGDLDVEFVVVTFSSTAAIEEYRHRTGVGARLLIDADRSAYRAYGFGTASLARVWGVRPALAYLRLFAKGHWRRLRRPTEDTRQLGGDVVIGSDGTVAFIHRSEGPDDRPEPESVIAAVS